MGREWIETAMALRESGMTYREIGPAVGKHHVTVYRALNPDAEARNREYVAAYNKAHPEINYASCVAHRCKDSYKAGHTARENKRRAMKHRVSVSRDRDALMAIYRIAREEQDVSCYLCGEHIPMGQRHVDHMVPLSRGGAHSPENLGIAHAFCNISKGVRLVEEIGFK